MRRAEIGFQAGAFAEIKEKIVFSIRGGKIISYFAELHTSAEIPFERVSLILGFVETLSFDGRNIAFTHSPRIGVLTSLKKTTNHNSNNISYLIGISTRVERFPKFILLSIEIFL